MEYIVVILISIISLIVLKFAFGIKIKNISKIKKIGNDKKLNDIANSLPSNQKICEEILQMLGNNSVKINVVEDKNKSLTYYSVISNSIIITNIKDTFTRIQTIAHECIHSTQNKRTLLFNFIFSNIYLIYFIAVCALTIFNVLEPSMLQVFILFVFGIVFYVVRSYLETDAMTKAPYLAKEYMLKSDDISKEDIGKIMAGYKTLNMIGISLVNYVLFCKVVIRIIVFCMIELILK